MSESPILDTEMLSVPTWLIRGGTSKGVYILESDLPGDRSLWGPYLIEMFGARDARQIDGVGGAMPTTSKCCIVGPSAREDADVDYTFAQVGIGEERVYWDFNCGNLTPSVGTYAILAGLVTPTAGITTVRVYQTNTRMLLNVEVPTGADGSPLVSGDYRIAGVTGTGPEVKTDFSRSVGASLGGALLPTGHRVDRILLEGTGEIEVSIVDLANMCVFFRAEDVGLTGLETVDEGPAVVDRFIAVRKAAQDLLGVDHSKTTPWPVAVSSARTYRTLADVEVAADDYDVAVRFAGIQPMRDTLHEAFPGTASCCAGVAAVVKGTIVNEIYAARPHRRGTVRLAHPSGVMSVEASAHEESDVPVADRAVIGRTARPIMRGEVYLRRSELERLATEIPVDDPARRVPSPGQPANARTA